MTLDFKEFGAAWVWNDTAGCDNNYVRFIQDFEATSLMDCRLFISADTDYIAYVNGELAGYGQYDDYPFYKVYDELEIGHLLRTGTNRLCILGYYQGVDSFQYYRSDAGILFAVTGADRLLAASGNSTLCSVCPAYEKGPMEKISPQLAFTFKYNAAKEDGWLTEVYRPEGWKPCTLVEKSCLLYSRPIKKLVTHARAEAKLYAQGVFTRENESMDIGLLMFQDYLSARRVFELSDRQPGEVMLPGKEPFVVKPPEDLNGKGIYLVFDLGREEVGLLNMELDAAEDTVFEVGYGEHLEDLRVRSHTGGRNFACRYISKGGRQSFTHYIKRMGCRYVQLNISKIRGDIKIYYAGLLPVSYPLAYREVDLKDRLHHKIYEVAVRTMELCMHEHYEDCPWREQALYTMDSRNQALCGYYSFGEYDFPESCIRLFALNLQEDGTLELCAPSRAPITIPSFTYIWVLELYEFWKHSGRDEFVKEMFDALKKICSNALQRVENGLVPCYRETRYWNFYDWADGLDGAPIFREYELEQRYDAPLNMFLIIALDCASQMAEMMGEQQLGEYWLNCAQQLRKAVRKAFFDGTAGLYHTYRKEEKCWHLAELTQALAIYSRCAEGEEAETLRRVLADKKNGLVPATLSYMAFKYDALLKNPEAYGKWVFDDIAEIWGAMLFKGATSFWETQKGASDFDDAGSLCHGWSAIPVYYYHKYGCMLK